MLLLVFRELAYLFQGNLRRSGFFGLIKYNIKHNKSNKAKIWITATGIWCHKRYADKNEKQVGCYVNLDGVETFSDT